MQLALELLVVYWPKQVGPGVLHINIMHRAAGDTTYETEGVGMAHI